MAKGEGRLRGVEILEVFCLSSQTKERGCPTLTACYRTTTPGGLTSSRAAHRISHHIRGLRSEPRTPIFEKTYHNCALRGFDRKLDGASKYVYMALATKIPTYDALLVATSRSEV